MSLLGQQRDGNWAYAGTIEGVSSLTGVAHLSRSDRERLKRVTTECQAVACYEGGRTYVYSQSDRPPRRADPRGSGGG